MGKQMDNDEVIISPNDFVTVTAMNHIIEVQHMEKMNRKANIKKLNKDEYVDIGTGEIRRFNHSVTRQDNYNSLRQTFKKLRYLINNNFVGQGNELHVTLTYKDNMTDTVRLYNDFKRFMTRLKRKYQKDTTIDYLMVVEPQERGAWHCHVLIRFNDLKHIYIPNEFDKQTNEPVNAPLYEMWGQGWVTIHSLKDVDNIGAYLSAYLADVELTDHNVSKAVSSDGTVHIKEVDGKKYIKGGRLHMYPPGMNLYRKSRGIVEPERVNMRFKDVKKIVGAATPHYGKLITIQDGEFENTIQYLQYNKKRTPIKHKTENN